VGVSGALAIPDLLDGGSFGSVEPMSLPAEVRHIMLAVTDGLGSQPLKVVVDDEGEASCFWSIEPTPLPAEITATRRSSASSQGRCLRDPVGIAAQDPPWPHSSFPC
jgi:hypothetical protein